ncbi:RCC1 domain-containing protein 1 isoform X2 [Athene noctua]|uniref:RCC1 domain-containing protein 1 isoform X2 n=1 Tax=Athene noctua TaxID=126797 RepID=UPI003EBFD7D9
MGLAAATVCLNRGGAGVPPGDTVCTKAALGPRPWLCPSVHPSARRSRRPPRCRPPSRPVMAAPRRSWLVFGFSTEEAAGEPGPGPGPRRLEPGPGGLRRVWPAWSYVVVETGAGLELRSAGLRRRLRGWAEALPSETHLVLRGTAGARAWPRAVALGAAPLGPPAWSRALPPGPRRPPPLPLLPGGFARPQPPFFSPLPRGVRARRLVLGHEHVLALGARGEVYAWGGGRHGQLGHGTLESELQPRLVEALAGVAMRAVAAGGWHSASVSEAGDLYMWGWNESGQLALPSKALAEERAQDEDTGAGVPGAAGPATGAGGQRGQLRVPAHSHRHTRRRALHLGLG